MILLSTDVNYQDKSRAIAKKFYQIEVENYVWFYLKVQMDQVFLAFAER
ncbi:hypothetical protein WKK05_28790 [Nostoc sp. UHCC 0302]